MEPISYQKSKTIFSTTIPVLVNHLNYGNHLAYDSLLSIIQEGRMRWLGQHDMSELSIEKSVGYLISDVRVNYQSEAFHGDTLEVSLYPDTITSRKFKLLYTVTNQTSGKTVALAETEHIFYDFSRKKVTRRPDRFSEITTA